MEKKEVFETKAAKETQKAGELLAKEILFSPRGERAVVICLNGDLGGGKTTFLQGFAKGLGIREKVLSPTFVILKRFEVKRGNYDNFYHMDCYRLQGEEDLALLGFKDVLKDPRNIIAIEWSERIKKALPKDSIVLDFDFLGEKERKITLKYYV
jgi:tRNA threonylcarbamoyladenosine biosynthesis protein TsaE